MAPQIATLHPPAVEPTARLEEDSLVLEGFREHDPQVVALAQEADNVEEVVHNCLAVGARALSAAKTTMDTALVEKAFEDMTGVFTRGLESFSREIEATSKQLLDGEEGTLPRSLEEFKGELAQLLDGTFDPDSKRSALAKLEEVMRRAAAEQVRAVRGLIDPDNEESPLGRYRSEIVRSVREETTKVHEAVQKLTTQLAVEEGKAEIFELTTRKGFVFEDELETRLIAACQPLGDIAERVGGTTGARGKKGDFQVTINPDDVAGKDVRYAIEAKNQQLNLRDTLRELDKVIANRDAHAGIAVFAKPEQCPGDEPFQHYGNRALVVYEPGTDGFALRLACCWARWIARRQLSAAGDTVDLDRIGALIEDARQALRAQTTIDRALTTSANKIGEAKKHLGVLVGSVEAALASIETEIAA